ncbi:hypothetical protein QE152_g30007 [Popillia japonica]|uniref:Uncharacterized protein n=1 Tax=Popillia japonica TaxID=7064 RepID=A0AAW1JF78_POPJA
MSFCGLSSTSSCVQPICSSRGVSRGTSRNRGRSRGNRGGRLQHDKDAQCVKSERVEEIESDGTIWKILDPNQTFVGRFGNQNILREARGPVAYAKRNVSVDKVSTAWHLIITENMLWQIQNCTDAEGRR